MVKENDMFQLTRGEIDFIMEAISLAVDEIEEGVEVETTGAVGMCTESLAMLTAVIVNGVEVDIDE